MEKGLVLHAADRDAAQFLDSYHHGRGIRLGVARVVLVRKGGEPLVAADPGPRPEAPMRSHRPPILLLRCQHVIPCCDGALRRPQPRRVTTNEAQRTAASRDFAPWPWAACPTWKPGPPRTLAALDDARARCPITAASLLNRCARRGNASLRRTHRSKRALRLPVYSIGFIHGCRHR